MGWAERQSGVPGTQYVLILFSFKCDVRRTRTRFRRFQKRSWPPKLVAMKSVRPNPAFAKAQRQRFIDAAREAGASGDEAVFGENLKRGYSAKAEKAEQSV